MKMNKRLLVTSGMMLSAVAIALSTNTYAWFTMSNENSLQEFKIEAAAASGGLEISLDGKTFSSDSVAMTAPDLKALDITSKDGKKFYKANFAADGTTIESLSDEVIAGVDYYETDIYFRTVAKGTIYVDKSSTVKCENTLTTGTGANKSSFGDFSRNYVASAARLSFAVSGYQNSTADKFTLVTSGTGKTERNDQAGTIIEPDNKVTHMDGETEVVDYVLNRIKLNKSAQTGAYSVNTNDTSWSDTVYEVDDPDAEDPDDIFSSTPVDTQGWGAASGDSEQALITIDGGTLNTFTTGQIQITKVTLRIWIEGQDNAAQTPLASGRFLTSLKFRLATDALTVTKVALKPAGVAINDGVITWYPVTGASGYEIYASTSTDGSNPVKIVADTSLPHPTASYTLTTADKKYDPTPGTDGDEVAYVWYGVKAIADSTLSDYYETGAVQKAIGSIA